MTHITRVRLGLIKDKDHCHQVDNGFYLLF
jgi:hypothetical protein